MAVQTRVKVAKLEATKHQGLDRDTLIHLYRTMYLSRRLDDREIQLKRQNKIYFQISSAGHEAVSAAAGLLLRPGIDWLYPYYRDRALCLMLGVTPLETLLQAVGAKDDPSSGGRQMPSHWGHRRWNIVSKSSCTGTQFVQAVGAAEATLYYEHHPKALAQAQKAPLGDTLDQHPDEIVYVSSGDGATSEGEFWESLNAACAKKLPLFYLIEDNGYAISVPIEVQTAGGSISKLVRGFPGLHVAECDGTDPLESYAVCKEAIQYVRERRGPALVHAHVTRPYSHSLSDDEKLYKTHEEREAEARRDPLSKFALFLIREGLMDQKEIEAMEAEVDREVRDATDQALAAEPPPVSSIHVNVYSPDIDPTSSAFAAEPKFQAARRPWSKWFRRRCSMRWRATNALLSSAKTLPTASREETLKDVKGKGGVFKATAGLQRKYGADRVFNTPIAEAAIVGRAIGMATRGLKPVAEIQFFDYIWPAMMQIRDELCVMRWRSNGNFQEPGGHARGHRRISHRRRGLSQPERRIDVHALPGLARGDALDRARCGGIIAHCDSLRRSGDVSRAQAPLPAALQPLGVSRPGLHGAVWQGPRGQGRLARQHHHLRRRGAPRGSGGRRFGARRRFRRDHRSPLALALRLGSDRRHRAQDEPRDRRL